MDIDKLKEKAFSSSEILQIIDGKANLLTYSELEKYKTLDDALGKYGALVLLYQTKSKNYGHWVAVFKVNKNTVEFFDSYGIFPDDEIDFVPKNFRRVNYKKFRHLDQLLLDSHYKIIYNEYKLQSDELGTNTCGRWVAVRLLMRKVSQQKFAKFFLRFEDPDWLITYLTSDY